MVSGRISVKTSRAPRCTKASAVEQKVKEGSMTSSPGFIWQSRADISRADVQDVVRYTAGECSRSLRKAWHLFVKGPSPQIFLLSAASFMYFVSVPTKGGLLKSIIYSLRLSFLQVSNRVMRIHPGHSGRSASFVVGGQYESNPVSEQVPCLGFTHISWVLNRLIIV